MVSIAAGTFLGGAFLHLLPESIELAEGEELKNIFLFTLIGIVAFFILEEFIHWHHHVSDVHHDKKRKKHHLSPIAVTNLIGDGFHNLLDGLAIAASFAISTEVGIATTLAIILHEIPQELADFGVLVYAGLSNKKAMLLNLASALLSILGVFIFFLFEKQFEQIEVYLLAFIAGVFIYIASTDLFPEIHKEKKLNILQVVCVILGIGLMYGLSLIG